MRVLHSRGVGFVYCFITVNLNVLNTFALMYCVYTRFIKASNRSRKKPVILTNMGNNVYYAITKSTHCRIIRWMYYIAIEFQARLLSALTVLLSLPAQAGTATSASRQSSLTRAATTSVQPVCSRVGCQRCTGLVRPLRKYRMLMSIGSFVTYGRTVR